MNMNKYIFIAITFITISACNKKEDNPKPDQKSPENKNYISFKIVAVSDADVDIRYTYSKIDPTIGMGKNQVYSLKETKTGSYPKKTYTIEDTILKRNELSFGTYNVLVSDPNQIAVKLYVDGVLKKEYKSNSVGVSIVAGEVK